MFPLGRAYTNDTPKGVQLIFLGLIGHTSDVNKERIVSICMLAREPCQFQSSLEQIFIARNPWI